MAKPKKEKKPKKPRAKKQTQKGQSQTQIVNITLPRARRGRPAKKSIASAVGQIGLPQTIIRMNEPPLPLPFQATQNLAIEPLKSVGDYSMLNDRIKETEEELSRITNVAKDYIQRQQQIQQADEPSTPFTPSPEPKKTRQPRSDKGVNRKPYKKKA